MFTLNETLDKPKESLRRDWHRYTKELLLNEFSKIEFDLEIKDVQSLWNNIENHLIGVTDEVAPLAASSQNKTMDSMKTPAVIKRKMNQQKKLIAKTRFDYETESQEFKC